MTFRIVKIYLGQFRRFFMDEMDFAIIIIELPILFKKPLRQPTEIEKMKVRSLIKLLWDDRNKRKMFFFSIILASI